MEQTTQSQEIVQAPPQPVAEIKEKKPKKTQKKPKKKRTKLIIWSVVLLVVVGYIGYSMYAASNYIPVVKAGEVSYQKIDAYLSTTATVVSPESISYFAPPQSKATEVHFKVGDTVKKGDIIATFDLSDLNDAVRMAQIDLSDANIRVTKAKDGATRQKTVDQLNEEIADAKAAIAVLENKKAKEAYESDYVDSGSPYDKDTWQYRINRLNAEITDLSAQLQDYPQAPMSELDLKSTENAAAKAAINLKSLQKYQDDEGIVAEADGIITQMNLTKGAPATNTSVACVIDSTEGLRAKFNIGKYDIGTIKLDQKATLSLGSMEYEGFISNIGSAAVKTTNSSGASTAASVPAELTIANPDENLVVGLDFDVEIHTFSNPHALSIPVESVLTDRDGDFCYKLIPSDQPEVFTYEKAYLTTGSASESYLEVLSGITEGEKIILSPPTTLELLPIVKVPALPAVDTPAPEAPAV